ncbi:MAG: YicC family protein [Synergistaceae bacterium]|nr:YicC family protein [Synergistaceae bacterium]
MYVSMTGFGAAAHEREWGKITLELSSVNHRYQEIYIRLPRELASFEPWLHNRLRGVFHRGKLNARVEITWAASAVTANVNKETLLNYYEKISEIRDLIRAGHDITLDALVNLPGVLDASGRGSIGEEAVEVLSWLVEHAASDWNSMRNMEGIHLKEAVEGYLADVERGMSVITSLWQGARDAAFEAMTGRVREALASAGFSADESRFAAEAVILADRWDISEEIDRMASHIAKFRETGDAKTAEGRKLDFLVQEMNREANTINSKISDAEIRWIAVEVKSSIERIREQIQNLE